MNEEQYLIKIIKYLINPISSEHILPLPDENVSWEKMLKIAGRHSIGNLLYYVMPLIPEELQPQENLKKYMQKLATNAVVLDVKQRLEKEELIFQFEKNQLYCMPVKGSDTKEYYIRSEWRTMGDLDVLYKVEQHQEVKELLLKMGYSNFESGLKHDHYSKPPFISLEMHRGLVAANTMMEPYYSDVWEKMQPRDGYKYVYQMSLEEQYIYTMVHLLEHFRNGGIGIRFVMDIFVFIKKSDLNREYVETVFEKLGIMKFAHLIEMLAKRWFDEEYVAEANEDEGILEELGSFIIENGTYGQSVHAQNATIEKEGRVGYIKQVVFPNYNSMQTLYPWLIGRPFLLPVAWIIRIMRTVLFRKDRIQKGINTVQQGNVQQGKELLEFYKRCGL